MTAAVTPARLFDRKLVRVAPRNGSEENVTAFLQGLLTNDVAGRLPCYAALLTAQGKVLADLIVWPAGEGLLLDCHREVAEDLVAALSRYRLRRAIDIAVDDSVGVFWQAERGDGGAPDPRLAALGERWVAALSGDDTAADPAWLAHRLALGVPEGPVELGDLLWLETNAVELNGVSFDKGCYVGQENTARMNWRQKINRRIVVVPLDRSDEKRRRVAYDDLGLAVDHRRVDDIPEELRPAYWSRG